MNIRKDNSMQSIQKAPVKQYGLTHASTYEAPKRGLLQRALGAVIPGVKDYYNFQDAQSYIDKTHLNPFDEERREKELQRSSQVYGTSRDEQFSLSQTGYNEQYGDKFESRALNYATENPKNYTYVSDYDEMRDGDYSNWNSSAVFGSKAGTLYSDTVNNNTMTGIDPYNVANVKYGSKFLGIFPRGYSGSVKQNPGIDSFVDKSHWEKQVKTLADRPLDSDMFNTTGRMGEY